jgi:hypothetical protein
MSKTTATYQGRARRCTREVAGAETVFDRGVPRPVGAQAAEELDADPLFLVERPKKKASQSAEEAEEEQ